MNQFNALFLVYGVFLQDQEAIVEAQEWQIMHRQGVFQPNPKRYQFWGCIFTNDISETAMQGILFDEFGQSRIKNIVITDTELSFDKTYDGHNPEEGIPYKFQNQGGVWVGIYSAAHTGTERAQCHLIPVSQEEFNI